MPNPIGPIISYYGSKWRAARYYPNPRHDILIEPFAGAAGYALHHWDKQVILIEKEPKIAAMWDYLIHATQADILSLPLLENIESSAFDLTLPNEESLTLIRFWMSAASTRPGSILTPFMKHSFEKDRRSVWGAPCRQRVANVVNHIKHWKIIHGSYEDAPDEEATWYIDPPYQKAGKFYTCSSDAIDFDALGVWCKSRKGFTMVCENEGATWLPFEHFRNIQAMHTHGKFQSKEVVWYNDPSLTGKPLQLFSEDT